MLILSYFQLILMTGLTTITHNGQIWKNYSRQHATNCTKSESLFHECSEMTLITFVLAQLKSFPIVYLALRL